MYTDDLTPGIKESSFRLQPFARREAEKDADVIHRRQTSVESRVVKTSPELARSLFGFLRPPDGRRLRGSMRPVRGQRQAEGRNCVISRSPGPRRRFLGSPNPPPPPPPRRRRQQFLRAASSLRPPVPPSSRRDPCGAGGGRGEVGGATAVRRHEAPRTAAEADGSAGVARGGATAGGFTCAPRPDPLARLGLQVSERSCHAWL